MYRMPTAPRRKISRPGENDARRASGGKRSGSVRAAPEVAEQRRVVADAAATSGAETERYARLVERSRDMILTMDMSGKVQSANPASQRLLGVSPAEIIGMNIIDFVVPSDHERAGIFVKIAAGAQFVQGDIEHVAKDGRRVFLDVMAYPIMRDGKVVGIEGIARDVTDRHNLTEALAHQAGHDALTGLPNRTLFFDWVAQVLARSGRRPSTVAVMLLDVDRFKMINDTFGHTVGDKLLRAIARRLSRVVRKSEGLARLGGDEFAIVFEGADANSEPELAAAADRILAALAKPLTVGDLVVCPTASIGIAVAGSGDDPAALMRNADIAMYQAKEDGRGTFRFFDERQRARVQHELELGVALARALDGPEIRMHYQPIVSLADNQLLGLEALVRWLHPQWGWVSPDEFVPAAEKSASIIRLGERVLADVIAQVVAWRAAQLARCPLGVSVNVSPQQLTQGDFVPYLANLLSENDLSPREIGIEITEHVIIDTSAQLDANLRRLAQMGTRLSIDDFGTGYSALSSLMRLPLSALKIDRAFVRDLGHDSHADSIVRACIDLARGQGLLSIAEGVENKEQADHLWQLGCEAAQGYYFGRPHPGGSLTEFLVRGARAPDATADALHSGVVMRSETRAVGPTRGRGDD
jgi:diguanylate cyclase (GGDEF)-like protein/PAS domain S-box-containing protein